MFFEEIKKEKRRKNQSTCDENFNTVDVREESISTNSEILKHLLLLNII